MTLIAVFKECLAMIGVSFGEVDYFVLKRDNLFIQKQKTVVNK